MNNQLISFHRPESLITKPKPKPAPKPNLNDIDVMTPELDYMPDAKADLILIAAVIVLGLLAVASWIVW